MPLYDFKCPECGVTEERYARMEERTQSCGECGSIMNRLITSKFHIDADYASNDFVTADITGSEVRVTSKKQMRDLCARNEVSPKYGKGWY